jgi:hypothetical protein
MYFGLLYWTARKCGCIGCIKFWLARRSWQLNGFSCAPEAPTSLSVAIRIGAGVRIIGAHVFPPAQNDEVTGGVELCDVAVTRRQ